VDELGPVSAGRKPIRIGSEAAIAGRARPVANEAKPAVDPARTWRRVIDIWFLPRVVLVMFALFDATLLPGRTADKGGATGQQFVL
jgi:hypothetical protein